MDRLTALYRMYGPVIYARCVRLLGDRAAAEDAMQETFVRVQRHLEKAPDAEEALRWVYRIATNSPTHRPKTSRRLWQIAIWSRGSFTEVRRSFGRRHGCITWTVSIRARS